MTEHTDDATDWTDNRPKQDSLIKRPERAEPETRIDRGASEEFADDRREDNETDTGEQAMLTPEGDENQLDLTGETAAETPEWSE